MIDDELLKRRKAAFDKTVVGSAEAIASAAAMPVVMEGVTPSAAQVRASGTDPDEFFQQPVLKPTGSRDAGAPASRAETWRERARTGMQGIQAAPVDERQRNMDEYGNSFGISGVSTMNPSFKDRKVVAAHADRIRSGYFDSDEYKKKGASPAQRNLDIYGNSQGFSGVSSMNPSFIDREIVSAHADRLRSFGTSGQPPWRNRGRGRRGRNEERYS